MFFTQCNKRCSPSLSSHRHSTVRIVVAQQVILIVMTWRHNSSLVVRNVRRIPARSFTACAL